MTKDEFMKKRGQQSVSEFKETFEEMLDSWMEMVCSEQFKSLRLSDLCVVFLSRADYGWKPIVLYEYIEIPHSHKETEIYDMYPDYYLCHGRFLVFNMCSPKLVYGDFTDNQIIEIVNKVCKAKLGDYYDNFSLWTIKQERCRTLLMGQNFKKRMQAEAKDRHRLEVSKIPFTAGRGEYGASGTLEDNEY